MWQGSGTWAPGGIPSVIPTDSGSMGSSWPANCWTNSKRRSGTIFLVSPGDELLRATHVLGAHRYWRPPPSAHVHLRDRSRNPGRAPPLSDLIGLRPGPPYPTDRRARIFVEHRPSASKVSVSPRIVGGCHDGLRIRACPFSDWRGRPNSSVARSVVALDLHQVPGLSSK